MIWRVGEQINTMEAYIPEIKIFLKNMKENLIRSTLA